MMRASSKPGVTDNAAVVIVGTGYVGITLTATLADLGLRVWAYDSNPNVVRALRRGRIHLFEPGVEAVLKARYGRNLAVEPRLPDTIAGVCVVCVSTPIGPAKKPNLANLRTAVQRVAERLTDGALLIVRSTVPVGTCRALVLPIVQATRKRIHLACCPERTIQGQALRELRALPQVIGALDRRSQDLAMRFWRRVTRRVVTVSSLEAAEMVKLINNCHTDVLYSYGNEVAMMAHRHGLDPLEVIRAANRDYPRPPLVTPGFVGGPCLSKDPYLLVSSVQGSGYRAPLVKAARALNEALPQRIAAHVVDALRRCNIPVAGAKVLVCGFAYKGWPITDDVRGSATGPILAALRKLPLRLYGHDYLVPARTIRRMGAAPVTDLREGFRGSHAVLFINDHPQYRALPIEQLTRTMSEPALLYDCWRIFDTHRAAFRTSIHYASIGYG